MIAPHRTLFRLALASLVLFCSLFVERVVAEEAPALPAKAERKTDESFLTLGKAERYAQISTVYDALLAQGLPAVRRAGEILVDRRHPVRAELARLGKSPNFLNMLLIRLIADSEASNVWPALVRYGWQEGSLGANLGEALARLPPNPEVIEFLKQDFLNARGSGGSRTALAWRDFDLMEWMAVQAELLSESPSTAAYIGEMVAPPRANNW